MYLIKAYLKLQEIFLPKSSRKNVFTVTEDKVLLTAIEDEREWLDSFKSENDCWSSFHANKSRRIVKQNDILPLIRETVHTLDTQYHCMKIICDTIEVINDGQTPTDVCDQPVYALTKQIQWIFLHLFQNYFYLFGGLHVEKSLLVIHGQFIKGSGLAEVLGKSNLSVIGLENTLLNANDIKRARYAVQVAACAIYEKLREAHVDSKSELDIWKWLEEKCENVMCLYWRTILELQINILIYVRSLRESNFMLHIASLRSLMKWYFSLDHIHYSRWLTVHLFDLLQLKYNFPDIFHNFNNGQFTFQKPSSQFSNMALDQVHEQNNT